MTSYTFQLICHGEKFFRTHSLFCPRKETLCHVDQSERSKWSRQQAQNLILRIFLIIIIIIRCSEMFRDVPACSGFYRRPAPRSNLLPFKIPFWQKRYPFYIPFIEKRYHFHIPTLEHCTSFISPCNEVNEQCYGRISIRHYQKK